MSGRLLTRAAILVATLISLAGCYVYGPPPPYGYGYGYRPAYCCYGPPVYGSFFFGGRYR